MMLATDLAVLDHLDGTVLLVANVITRPRLPPDARLRRRARPARRDDRATWPRPAPASAAMLDPPPSRSHAARRSRLVVPAGGRARQGGDPGRRGVPGRAVATVRDGDRRRLARRLPRAAHHQPQPVHVPAAVRRLRRRRLQPGAAGAGRGTAGAGPADRRQPTARGDAGRGRRTGAELLADTKERAEHLMLVDLGRNDLGRVCTPGSVEVVDSCPVERYSHVMHLVSTVVGELSPRAGRVRRPHRVLPGRHAVRRAEAARDGADRGARADPARPVRRRRRLRRLPRRPRHRDRDPHRAGPRRDRVRPGRSRHRGRLRPGGRGRRVRAKAARGAPRGRRGRDAADRGRGVGEPSARG